jgi:hypothetical protein
MAANTGRIRIDRGFMTMAQRSLDQGVAAPPPAAPPPPRPRRRKWMTVAAIVAGVLVVGGVIVGIASCPGAPPPAAPPAGPIELTPTPAGTGGANVAMAPPTGSAAPAAGPATPAATAGGWRSREFARGSNRVANADFGQADGTRPRGWTAPKGWLDAAWSVAPTNSPLTAFFAANGCAGRFGAAKAGTGAVYRCAIGRVLSNCVARGECVLFAWDMRAPGGTEEWAVEDQVGGAGAAFAVHVRAGTVDLNGLAFGSAPLASNAWCHVEVLVDYADGSGGVSGGVYDAAGRRAASWVKFAQASLPVRRKPAPGCDALVVRPPAKGGSSALLLDNVYVGLAAPRQR